MIVLDKLVALRCRDPQLLDLLCELAGSDRYAPTLAEIERCADGGGDPDPALTDADTLYRLIAQKDLRELFRGEPKLSAVPREDLLTQARFSDVQPDAVTMFRTTDPVFMRLADLSKQGPVDVTKLMLDDFCQLAIVAVYYPHLWNDLCDLARGNWTADMLAVELFLTDRTVPGNPLAASFAQAVDAAQPTADGTVLANVMLTPPRFSAMLAAAVLAYDGIRAQLPNPDDLIDRRFTPEPSAMEKGRTLARPALAVLQPPIKEAVEHGYKLRHKALKELTNRRLFVKRDALEHNWPGLYDRMRRDFAGMVRFEKQIQQPDSSSYSKEQLASLQEYLNDERLARVLSLQPYFGHLMDAPLPSKDMPPPAAPFGATATAMPPESKSSQPVSTRPQQQTALPPLASTSAYLQPFSADQAVVPSFTELPEVQYDDVHIAVERFPGTTTNEYRVTLRAGMEGPIFACESNLDWAEIREQVQHLQFSRDMREGMRAVAVPPDFTSQLKKLGLMVYDSLFRGEVRNELRKLLSSARHLRLHWLGDPSDPSSAALPWECLYVPQAPVSFLALTRKYSLTRRIEATSMEVSPIGKGLRMLFVTASPKMVPPLPGIEQEIETVAKALNSSADVELMILKDADVERVNHMIREFRPHVFHFSGHGVFRPDTGAGELMFQTTNGDAHPITADNLAVMLYENDVSLAVLNGCDTGVSATNDAVSSVAGALVKAGVPAVVATMREVWDEAATRFSREFYRSFAAGFTVESCMGEARKALTLDNWDWSAYALFVGSADLNRLRVSGPVRSQP